LVGAVFYNCDLSAAVFENTHLEKADFRTAYNYHLDPESNRLKGAKFSFHGLPGLLGKYGLEIE
jgi:fluoroquinolone resistance protein